MDNANLSSLTPEWAEILILKCKLALEKDIILTEQNDRCHLLFDRIKLKWIWGQQIRFVVPGIIYFSCAYPAITDLLNKLDKRVEENQNVKENNKRNSRGITVCRSSSIRIK